MTSFDLATDRPAAVAEAADETNVAYVEIEQRITEADGAGIIARWEFGRELLIEREVNGGRQLPHGRLAEICEATGKSEREIRYRIQLAEKYRTREEVGTAVPTFGSWSELRDSLGRQASGVMSYDEAVALLDDMRSRELDVAAAFHALFQFLRSKDLGHTRAHEIVMAKIDEMVKPIAFDDGTELDLTLTIKALSSALIVGVPLTADRPWEEQLDEAWVAFGLDELLKDVEITETEEAVR